MDKITALFDKIDLTKLVPPMDTLLDKMQFIVGIVILVGPLVMLVLGLWYLLLPPKEANYSAGFRTWFGMGSVEAWRMTQKIAGFAWTGIGLVMSAVMWFVRRGFAELEIMELTGKAFTCVLWQVIIAAGSYVLICLAVLVLFDYRGNFRWKRRAREEREPQDPVIMDQVYEEPVFAEQVYAEPPIIEQVYEEPPIMEQAYEELPVVEPVYEEQTDVEQSLPG